MSDVRERRLRSLLRRNGSPSRQARELNRKVDPEVGDPLSAPATTRSDAERYEGAIAVKT